MTTLPEITTIEHKQGDSLAMTLTLTEDDNTTAIDLTGWSVEFSAAKDRGRTPAWTFIDDPDHAIISDPQNGVINIALHPNDSRAFGKLEVVPFEVTIENPDGYRITILEGEFDMRLEVADETKAQP